MRKVANRGVLGAAVLALCAVSASGDVDYDPARLISATRDVVLATPAAGHMLQYDGTVWRNVLYQPRWEDLRFPSSGINPIGAAADPGRSNVTGLLEFSGSADNLIAGIAQMPHSWKEGSTISPHLHLRFATSATCNTRWKLEYDIANPNGLFANDSGVYTDGGTITIANPANVRRHVIAEWADLTMVGYTISANVSWRVSRLASSDGADTCTAVTELLDFDIHYQADSLGASAEYVK